MLFWGVNKLKGVIFLILLFCVFFELLINVKLFLLMVRMKIDRFNIIIVIIFDIL